MPKPDNLIDLATFKQAQAKINEARGHTPAANPYARKQRQPVASTGPQVPQLLVGIDPGEHTGVAQLDKLDAQPELQLQTLDFWETVRLLERLALTEKHRVHIYIEDPNEHRSLYHDKDDKTGEIRTKVAQNVGANKREAALLIKKCHNLGLRVTTVKPGDVLTKLSATEFARITGYTKRCSEHARDAGCLIFGR